MRLFAARNNAEESDVHIAQKGTYLYMYILIEKSMTKHLVIYMLLK